MHFPQRSVTLGMPRARTLASESRNDAGSDATTQAAASSSSPKGFAKLRALVKEYGALGIGVYAGVYLSTLGSLFLAVDCGLLPAGDALSMLRSVGADRLFDLDKLNPKTSNFAIAWILAKFTEPLRMLVTLAITPRLARLIRRPRP